MAAVSIRYADALMNSVKDKDKAAKSLETIANLYLSNTEFKETFNNPRIKNDKKLEIIKEIIPNDEIIMKFISLILAENRFNLIADIYKKFQEMLDELNKKVNIKIISSCKLTDKEIEGVVAKYKKLFKANEISYETSIDESVIGGIKVIAGGKIYDATIKTKLDEML